MPDTGSALPALSDAALRETLDLMGQVVANMAGKLDRQTLILTEVQATARESRDAARKAQAQSDPGLYGRHIGQALDKALDTSLDRLTDMQSGFATDRDETRQILNELVQQEEAVLHRLRNDLEDARRWKSRLPFMALIGLVFALGFGIALPRVLPVNKASCAVLGGQWLERSESADLGCVLAAR